MIAVTSTVLEWYRQQIAPPLAIFKEAESKQRRISIHTIININARLPSYDSSHHMGNTLALLRLRRKREPITVESLRTLGRPHQVTGPRIARAMNRANSRKAG